MLGLVAGPVLRRLPEPDPADVPDGETKTPYAALADHRFGWARHWSALASAGPPGRCCDPAAQPPWIMLGTLGVLLALIDLRTTWLPLRLARRRWLLMAFALIIAA